MADPLDDLDEPATDARPSDDAEWPVSTDSHGIGTRVSAVFTAAEKAANDMLQLARAQADDILLKAEAEAATHVSERRSRAEEEARRVVAEAEAEAQKIRYSARENAREIEEAARRREKRVREETDHLLDRVEWAREGIDEVIARLQDVRPTHRIPTPEPPREAEAG